MIDRGGVVEKEGTRVGVAKKVESVTGGPVEVVDPQFLGNVVVDVAPEESGRRVETRAFDQVAEKLPIGAEQVADLRVRCGTSGRQRGGPWCSRVVDPGSGRPCGPSA